MEYTVAHDETGTHIDWSLNGITAQMIDWFWSNLEKGFILWHPEEHEMLEWLVPIRHGDLRGAIHNAPQTWGDGHRRDLYIKFGTLDDLTPTEKSLISHEHVLVTLGVGFSKGEINEADPLGVRLHQWTKSDCGVTGRSSGVPRKNKETESDGKIWAAHAAQEVGNWEVFLPQLYELYTVVRDPKRNPFTDLSVDGQGSKARYRHMS